MFTFKGVSAASMGIQCLPFTRVFHAPERVQQTVIPGKSGTYDYTDNTYDNGSVSISAVYWGSTAPTTLRAVAAWLTGSGQLIFDDEPDKAYTASVIEGFDVNRNHFEDSFTISFTVFPFAESIGYNQLQAAAEILPYSQSVSANGTADSPCIIRITAVTDIDNLMIIKQKLI